jgi:hypothetical protein
MLVGMGKGDPGRDPAGARLRRIFGVDMVLLHAPSVWDFRDEVIVAGPLADVIPSTTEFEMYPVGLTSIAAYLEANNYNVRMVNLAYRMLRRPGFDVPARMAAARQRSAGHRRARQANSPGGEGVGGRDVGQLLPPGADGQYGDRLRAAW